LFTPAFHLPTAWLYFSFCANFKEWDLEKFTFAGRWFWCFLNLNQIEGYKLYTSSFTAIPRRIPNGMPFAAANPPWRSCRTRSRGFDHAPLLVGKE
jgi:hypothetical protein